MIPQQILICKFSRLAQHSTDPRFKFAMESMRKAELLDVLINKRLQTVGKCYQQNNIFWFHPHHNHTAMFCSIL